MLSFMDWTRLTQMPRRTLALRVSIIVILIIPRWIIAEPSLEPYDVVLFHIIAILCFCAPAFDKKAPWLINGALWFTMIITLVMYFVTGFQDHNAPVCSLSCVDAAAYAVFLGGKLLRSNKERTQFLVFTGLLAFAWAVLVTLPAATPPSLLFWLIASVLTGLVLGCVGFFHLLGDRSRKRDDELESLKEKAALAAVVERTRIAREMHDIVAHNLAAVISLADGARYAAKKIQTSPLTRLPPLRTRPVNPSNRCGAYSASCAMIRDAPSPPTQALRMSGHSLLTRTAMV